MRSMSNEYRAAVHAAASISVWPQTLSQCVIISGAHGSGRCNTELLFNLAFHCVLDVFHVRWGNGFRTRKWPPNATKVVLVFVIRFSKIPQGFVNKQPIVIKLHIDVVLVVTNCCIYERYIGNAMSVFFWGGRGLAQQILRVRLGRK